MTNTQEDLKKARLNLEYASGQPRSMGADYGRAAGQNLDWGSGGTGAAGNAAALNIYGLSESTQTGLQQYSQGYMPSQSVNQAKEYLQGVMNSQPEAFQSKYTRQIADLYDRIMNRPVFKYDVSKDPLFASYKNQYMQGGQRAMQDAMGTAAALTGGYGNSWGATAGYQAYQWYLQQLNSAIPQLEQYAFDQYKYYGEEMRRNMDLTNDLDSIDYSRYRDTVDDWQTSAAMAQNAYQFEKQSDLAVWENMLDHYQNMAEMENSNYWAEQNLEEKQRQADLDEAYRQAQLAESVRQYNSTLVENQRQYDLSLNEKQREFDIAQDLSQEKFDFQLRQYEDKLKQLEQQSGGGSSTGNSGGTVIPSAGKAGNRLEDGEMTVLPVMKTNLQGDVNYGPLAQSTPAMPVSQADALLDQMEALYQNSTQGQKKSTAWIKLNR
ncbi:MAG: hypothetical protein IKN04_01180 [Clostridia bacterium]|nr:hypothetical protein [Clostridia bacterium]